MISLGLLVSGGAVPADDSGTGNEPYPLEYWALRDVVSNVQVSPDGNRIGMIKILSKNGDPILHVYDADNLEDPDPIIVNADPMEIRNFEWVNDQEMVLSLRQRIRKTIDGQDDGVFASRITRLNVDNLEFEDFGVARPAIENLVRNDPNTLIVSTIPGIDDNVGFGETFRPRAYYKLDLRKGTEQLLIRGKLDKGVYTFDADGDPYLAFGFDRNSKSFAWYYRPKGGKGWDEIYRRHEDSFEEFEVVGKDEAVPDNLLVRAHNGNNFIGLWSFNTKTKTFGELIYRRNDVDVYGVRMHSDRWNRPDTVAAVSYFKDKFHYEYFDEIEGATFRQLQELIPYAHYLSISSRSKSGDTLIVYNEGPRDPGTYYMYRKGVIEMIGSRQPLLESEKLADQTYVTYEARDGRKIPAFVTVPTSGKGPFPAVVINLGGPEVHITPVFRDWAQMLANNGYVVIEVSHRITEGYGMDHFLSGFAGGSQLGRATQDDMDDGLLYLVEQGLADRDRFALFGWSAGGTAALVAAARTPQIYQCTIAGAPVADPLLQKQYMAQARARGFVKKIYENRYAGVRPIDHVEDVSVPILLVHGDVDSRVQYAHARKYAAQLEKHNKHYRFVTLAGSEHSPESYENNLKLYESLIEFLANECGMKPELTVQAAG